MSDAQFDATETVGGFPLIKIKRALSWVGLMDDRDDVKSVGSALGCSRSQAERVLAALERRRFVTKAKKKNQWEKTRLGYELAMRWHPPRRLDPVVLRDEEDGPTNLMLESVPCAILRSDSDDSDVFEEADLEVGVFVDYESPRVIEISVSQPEDYDDRDWSAVIETSVYLGVEDAKKFSKALQEAIEKAEAEIVRRGKVTLRRKKRVETSKAPTRSNSGPSASATTAVKAASNAPSNAAQGGAVPSRRAPTSAAPSTSSGTSRKQDALAATLQELRQRR